MPDKKKKPDPLIHDQVVPGAIYDTMPAPSGAGSTPDWGIPATQNQHAAKGSTTTYKKLQSPPPFTIHANSIEEAMPQMKKILVDVFNNLLKEAEQDDIQHAFSPPPAKTVFNQQTDTDTNDLNDKLEQIRKFQETHQQHTAQ